MSTLVPCKQAIFEESVETIGNAYLNHILHYAILSSVTSIGNYALRSCSGLEAEDTGECLETIGNYAF